jgi:hypothetical protein
MTIKFPQTVAAAKAMEHDQWKLGDALLKECGLPGDSHANNGSSAKLQAAQAELEAHGIEYEISTLRRYRDTAHAFPHASRIATVSHRVHIACGTPTILNAVLAAWRKEKGDDKPLALHACTHILTELHRQRMNKWHQESKVAHDTAKAKRDKAQISVREAKTKHNAERTETSKAAVDRAERAAREADKEVEATRPPPKGNPLAVPTPEKLTSIVYSLEVISKARQAIKLAELIEEMSTQTDLRRLDDDALAGGIEQSLIAANKWREIAQMLQGLTSTKGVHLAAVGT